MAAPCVGPLQPTVVERASAYVAAVNPGTIKAFRISEAEDDPAGDGDPSGSCVDAMLEAIDQVKAQEL